MKHTVEEDFEHFLSYSGYWKEDEETKIKLMDAFKAAWEPAECQS